MRLLSMRLTNFRQFYGSQELRFAGADRMGRNVTVIHGFNGAGKTALLNAFVWGLYGETTPDLDEPQKLHSERAIVEARVGEEIDVSVTIDFERHDRRYRVHRRRVAEKRGDNELAPGRDSMELFETDRDGSTKSVGVNDGARQKKIEHFLPKTLYPFFFFNGERVERLASPSAYDEVEAGVKTLLDIELYERSERHLRSAVAGALREDLKRHGSSETQDVVERRNALERELSGVKSKKDKVQANANALLAELERIEAQQVALAATADLAKQRGQLQQDLSKAQASVGKEKRSLAQLISRNGFLAFSARILDRTDELVRDARQRGEIPSKIKPQFVDDLIERRECICGRPLEPGSKEQRRLADWRSTTGLADLEEEITHLAGQTRILRDRRKQFFEDLDAGIASRDDALRVYAEVRDRLSVVESELGDGSLGEDAAKLNDTRVRRDFELREARVQEILCARDEGQLEDAIKAMDAKLRMLKSQDDRFSAVQRQLEAVERVAGAFGEIAAIQKNDVRQSLDESISEIWRDAAIKDYTASVTDKYRLLLKKRVGGVEQQVVGASTGEKQVLALSFVGSLVRKARENEAQEQEGVNLGGEYPLVMDSPFGSLEDDYRAKVAEWIPRLADQVVVMVSKTQWRNEVETAMRDRIGCEYILELHTAKPGTSREIVLETGEVRDYVVETPGEPEWTRIAEVY